MAGEQLRVTEGKERGKALKVDADLQIGRVAPDAEGRLGDDPLLSRRHARVSRRDAGQLTIEDLGSANGTFVNEERIEGLRTLELGDLVRVGHTVLQVTDASGGVPEATRLEGAPAAGLVAEAGEQLLVTDGMAKGRRLTLGEELLVGRAMGEEGRLGDDPELSRRHARLARAPDGRLAIEDLGSANGTFVNGMRVSERKRLAPGDSIRVGKTTLEVVDSTQAPERPTPEPPPTAPESQPTVPEPQPPAPATPPRAPEPQSPAPAPARPPRASEPQSPAPARPPRAPEPRSPAPAKPPQPSGPPPRAPARPARAPARAPAPAPAAPAGGRAAADLPLGAVFAGCRVEEVIGRGDMGVVYRAEELALQRRVALKLIRPDQSEEERFRERFRRESKVAASIDHPNVIPILEAGEEDGVLFITMRFVEGTDLRAVISAEGRVDPQRTARIVREVGAGLDAAHKRGLVHRDVKPANVLLARADHVYLSDFGLAKQASAAGGLTRQGSIIARAEYVAPEQVTEDRIDARTDVYALGCLLFETLTGEAPFGGEKGGGAIIAHVEAPPPSAVALVPGLPRQFDDVVSRAMAKNPDERYSSAGDLGEAALVAAGELRQVGSESIVATGEAAPATARRGPRPAPGAQPASDADGEGPGVDRQPGHSDALRWGVAIAALVVLAVFMVVALGAISKL